MHWSRGGSTLCFLTSYTVLGPLPLAEILRLVCVVISDWWNICIATYDWAVMEMITACPASRWSVWLVLQLKFRNVAIYVNRESTFVILDKASWLASATVAFSSSAAGRKPRKATKMRLRNSARRRVCRNGAFTTRRHCADTKREDGNDEDAGMALRTRHKVLSREAQQKPQQERTHVSTDLAAPGQDIDDSHSENSVHEPRVDVHTVRRRKVVMGRVDVCLRRRKPLQERSVAVDDSNRIQIKEKAAVGGLKRAATGYYGLLQNAFASEDRIDETNWLTSTLIDFMLWRLATQYPGVHFLATDFCHLHLPSVARQIAASRSSVPCEDTSSVRAHYQIRDVLGRTVDYEAKRPLVFVANVGSIHWNLLRVQFDPIAELQLFEPMGRLSSRSGVSYRSVPRCVIEWLDACYPSHKTWISRSVSAITRPQQVSGFDCGVACLLYADKCGQGQPRETINDSTSQQDITVFRSELQRQLKSTLQGEL